MVATTVTHRKGAVNPEHANQEINQTVVSPQEATMHTLKCVRLMWTPMSCKGGVCSEY